MENKEYVIYKLTAPNGKIYIGLTANFERRMKQHPYEKQKSYLYNSINKYGWENFEKEIIDTCDNYLDLKAKEIYYIHKYNSFHKGMNGTKGGEGALGRDKTQEEKEKIALTKSGGKKIYIYNKKGTLINNFILITDASRFIGVTPSSLSNNLNKGTSIMLKGFYITRNEGEFPESDNAAYQAKIDWRRDMQKRTFQIWNKDGELEIEIHGRLDFLSYASKTYNITKRDADDYLFGRKSYDFDLEITPPISKGGYRQFLKTIKLNKKIHLNNTESITGENTMENKELIEFRQTILNKLRNKIELKTYGEIYKKFLKKNNMTIKDVVATRKNDDDYIRFITKLENELHEFLEAAEESLPKKETFTMSFKPHNRNQRYEGRCSVCNRKLSQHDSVANGMGKRCANNEHLKAIKESFSDLDGAFAGAFLMDEFEESLLAKKVMKDKFKILIAGIKSTNTKISKFTKAFATKFVNDLYTDEQWATKDPLFKQIARTIQTKDRTALKFTIESSDLM